MSDVRSCVVPAHAPGWMCRLKRWQQWQQGAQMRGGWRWRRALHRAAMRSSDVGQQRNIAPLTHSPYMFDLRLDCWVAALWGGKRAFVCYSSIYLIKKSSSLGQKRHQEPETAADSDPSSSVTYSTQIGVTHSESSMKLTFCAVCVCVFVDSSCVRLFQHFFCLPLHLPLSPLPLLALPPLLLSFLLCSFSLTDFLCLTVI